VTLKTGVFSFAITGMNYILKYIKIENGFIKKTKKNYIYQYYHFYCIFYQIKCL